MSDKKPKAEERNHVKHVSSHGSQQKQVEDVVKQLKLDEDQRQQLHEGLAELRSAGETPTFKDILNIGTEIKSDD